MLELDIIGYTKNMSKNTTIFVILLVLVAGAYYVFSNDSEDDLYEEEKIEETEEMTYSYSGTLEDVSGGDSSGVVQAIFEDGTYSMRAAFADLPAPEGTDFYEGWIVRKGEDFDTISTGEAVLVDGEYVNTYEADQDLTDHSFYVLTIEPDDGDPAPADHVLEGTLSQ